MPYMLEALTSILQDHMTPRTMLYSSDTISTTRPKNQITILDYVHDSYTLTQV